MSKEHVGIKIKRLRGFRGLTQQELADAVGKTRSLISYYERSGNINRYVLKEIADVLQITPQELDSFEVDSKISDVDVANVSIDKNDLMAQLIDQQRREIEFLKELTQKQLEIISQLQKNI